MSLPTNRFGPSCAAPVPIHRAASIGVSVRETSAAAPEFTVGYDGRAFIENLSADNEVVVRFEAGSCHARFPFAPRDKAQVSIGPVRCQ